MQLDHTYRTNLAWQGSTSGGYRAYNRTHTVTAPPATTHLELSADPAFRGTADLLNPEQLLVMAASSCQLLSFLAIAARHGVVVLDYTDDATGTMPTTAVPVRLTEIALAPHIVVADGTDLPLVERLVDEAHGTCYIANSLTTEVTVRPTVVTAAVSRA